MHYVSSTPKNKGLHGAMTQFLDNCSVENEHLKVINLASVIDWMDYSARVIIIDGVDEESAVQTMGLIQRYNREDDLIAAAPHERSPIKLFILSPGGDVVSTLNIIDTIEYSTTPVYGFAYQAYSAGGIIFLACHKRFCYPNSTFLLHDGYAAMANTASKTKDTMEFYDKIDARIKAFVLSKTLITEEEFDRNYSKDWYFFAEDMIRLKMADAITTCLPFSLEADRL